MAYETNLSGTTGATCTSDASAHTKGAWTEIISSTAAAAVRVVVYVRGATSGRSFLLDIGTGAIASEAVAIGNLIIDSRENTVNSEHAYQMQFLLAVPAGTRLSCRCQDNSGSGQLEVFVVLQGADSLAPPAGTSLNTYGAVTASSLGTSITATSGGESSWVELTSSSAADLQAFYVMTGNNGATARAASRRFHCDIGTGAIASEVAVLEGMIYFQGNADEGMHPDFHGPYYVSIPSGTRIVARGWASGGTSNDFDIVLIGVSGLAAAGGAVDGSPSRLMGGWLQGV